MTLQKMPIRADPEVFFPPLSIRISIWGHLAICFSSRFTTGRFSVSNGRENTILLAERDDPAEYLSDCHQLPFGARRCFGRSGRDH